MELIEIEPLDTLDHLVSIILLHWVSAHFKTRKYMHFSPPITQIFSNTRSEEFTGHNLISNRTCRAVADKQPVHKGPLFLPHTLVLSGWCKLQPVRSWPPFQGWWISSWMEHSTQIFLLPWSQPSRMNTGNAICRTDGCSVITAKHRACCWHGQYLTSWWSAV